MAQRWFGYGRWEAPYWFIGPEPGMGAKEGDNLEARRAAWKELGGGELLDCMEHHKKLGWMKWHRAPNPPTQPTWRQLIRLLLAYKGLPTDNDTIRGYQRREWGSATGETCVIELSAIAANSLATKRAERTAFREGRVDTIRARVMSYRPLFVVVYGLTNRENWQSLIRGRFDDEGFAKLGESIVCMAKHPVGGKPAEPAAYWIRLGSELREKCVRRPRL